MRMRIFVLLSSVGLITACSGTKNGAPVALQPGRYDVSISNPSPQFGPRSETKSLCFTPDHAANFASEPLKDIVPSGDGCDTTPAKRDGNSFGGTRQCTAPPIDGMTMKMALNWTGQVEADAFTIDADASGDFSGHALNSHITITGKRSGDC